MLDRHGAVLLATDIKSWHSVGADGGGADGGGLGDDGGGLGGDGGGLGRWAARMARAARYKVTVQNSKGTVAARYGRWAIFPAGRDAPIDRPPAPRITITDRSILFGK